MAAMADRARSARIAVTVVFALNGVLFASLFARLPAIRDNAGLSVGQIGLVLFCSMAGLLIAQPLSGALSARHGSRPVVAIGAAGYALGVFAASFGESMLALAGVFLFTGAANGLLDVAMNVQGLTVEAARGRRILGSLHAAFSFGALTGALLGGFAAEADLGLTAHLAAVAGAALLILALAAPRLLAGDGDAAGEGPRFARPTRALAALGVVAFCALLAEGAMNDWTAIYFTDSLGTEASRGAFALAAFSLSMAAMRLLGDRVAERLGPGRVVRAGGLAAAAGVALMLATETPAVATGGTALAGLGLAIMFPLTVRAAGLRRPPAGPSVAAISVIGYTGFLVGPPAIGGLAELTSLRAALVLVAVLGAVAAAFAGAVDD